MWVPIDTNASRRSCTTSRQPPTAPHPKRHRPTWSCPLAQHARRWDQVAQIVQGNGFGEHGGAERGSSWSFARISAPTVKQSQGRKQPCPLSVFLLKRRCRRHQQNAKDRESTSRSPDTEGHTCPNRTMHLFHRAKTDCECSSCSRRASKTTARPPSNVKPVRRVPLHVMHRVEVPRGTPSDTYPKFAYATAGRVKKRRAFARTIHGTGYTNKDLEHAAIQQA